MTGMAFWVFLAACSGSGKDSGEELFDDDGDSVLSSVDCDDGDADIYPGADELCDGVDSDCDGLVDENPSDGGSWVPDADGDGYTLTDARPVVACEAPDGYIIASAEVDCDDEDDTLNPAAVEDCDGIDNDCDGVVDDGYDEDGDGWSTCVDDEDLLDCNDANADTYPGADEVWYDGEDNDCDPSYVNDDDQDLDGVTAQEVGGEDCDDTQADIPNVLEAWDGQDNDCDGAVDEETDGDYLSVVDAQARFIGSVEGDRAARSIAWAGDVNGDGEEDAVIGAILSGTGAMYLVTGPFEGDLDLKDSQAQLIGLDGGHQSGISVSGGGDFNDDGYDDIIAGSYANEVYLVFGGPDLAGEGSLGDSDIIFLSTQENDQTGRSVSAGGDANGDGIGDLLIGAPGHEYERPWDGAAFLVLGGIEERGDVSLEQADAIIVGEENGDSLGHAVQFAGDVNGDGLDDLVMSAFGDGTAASFAGAAYLVLSPVEGVVEAADADAKYLGEAEEDRLARSCIDSAGDVNNDGLADLLMGSTLSDTNGTASGSAWVMFGGRYGTLSLGVANLHLLGEASGDGAGRSVSSAGDVTGDGIDDILVGAPHAEVYELSEGAIYVVAGSPLLNGTLPLRDSAAKIGGHHEQDFLGWWVDGGRDADGDGLNDLLLGAYLGDTDDGGTNHGTGYLVLGGQL